MIYGRIALYRFFYQLVKLDMEYVMSQKGKRQLCHEGYNIIYNKDRTRDTKTYWKCVLSDCRGRAITNDDEIRTSQPHNHAPDQ